MNRTQFQDALHGFPILRRLEFVVESQTEVGALVLELARDESEASDLVRATFEGVSNLSAQGLGGGLTQLLYLIVEDIQDQQLDRLTYSVHEVERRTISFLCRSISIEKLG